MADLPARPELGPPGSDRGRVLYPDPQIAVLSHADDQPADRAGRRAAGAAARAVDLGVGALGQPHGHRGPVPAVDAAAARGAAGDARRRGLEVAALRGYRAAGGVSVRACHPG